MNFFGKKVCPIYALSGQKRGDTISDGSLCYVECPYCDLRQWVVPHQSSEEYMPEFVCKGCRQIVEHETRIIKPGAVFTGKFLVKDIGAPYPKKKGISYGRRKRTRHLIPLSGPASADLVSASTAIVLMPMPAPEPAPEPVRVKVSDLVPTLVRPQVIALPWRN